jgi:hypothetical protein
MERRSNSAAADFSAIPVSGVMTRDVEVLHIFPPRELIQRIAELENPRTTVKDVKAVFKKADEINVLSSHSLVKMFNGIYPTPQPKKKKPKKKK